MTTNQTIEYLQFASRVDRFTRARNYDKKAYLIGGPKSLAGRIINTDGEPWLHLHHGKDMGSLLGLPVFESGSIGIADYQRANETPEGNYLYVYRPRTSCVFQDGPAHGCICTMNFAISDEIIRTNNGHDLLIVMDPGKPQYVLTHRKDHLGRRVLVWTEPERSNWKQEGF